MADSCCIVELKETIANMNAELSQSHTKISELDAKVRALEKCLLVAQKEISKLQEENARLARDLKEDNAQLARSLKEENVRLARELKEENARLARDLKEENARLARDLKEQNARLARDLKEENARLARDLKEENARLARDLKEENARLARDLKEENARLARDIKEVNETNDNVLNINALPNHIILEVFSYLEQNQLGHIARVCRRWNVLTKSPLLWKKVDVQIFFPSYGSEIITVKSFINTLPSCVTSIRLGFVECDYWIEPLDFEELCVRLQEKCPNLEKLILSYSVLSNSLSSVISLCSIFLQDVKKLIFNFSTFRSDRTMDEYSGISKIKSLELIKCKVGLDSSNKSPFSKMRHLKQLHLCSTNVDYSWFMNDISFLNQLHVLNMAGTEITAEIFQAIQNHGINLKEFYVCLNMLQDHDLTFTNSAFPHLKTICLSHTNVTCEGVVSFIQSCPSLETVYVTEDVAESFAAHPFFVANICKSGIIKVIDTIHIHNA